MTWAMEDARLDFVTHSEHDIWLDDSEWQHLKDNVEAIGAGSLHRLSGVRVDNAKSIWRPPQRTIS